MSKDTIAEELELYSELLDIDGQSGRAHAYDKAARAVDRANHIPANPSRLNGIGDSTREAVIDLENGIAIDELDELKEKYSWYTELRQVDYIGPERAVTLHNEYAMDSLEDLALMKRADDLTAIDGVGQVTADKIAKSIETLM